jgi:tRNA pseudouridine65 synthase
LIGDVRYGKGEHNRLFRERYGLHRLALHCASLAVAHPDGGRLVVSCALAADIAKAITGLAG